MSSSKKKKQDVVTPLCMFDSKTRLIASRHGYSIQMYNGTVWSSRWYYGEVWDAIRGYARHYFQQNKNTKHINGDIKKLIEAATKLEEKVAAVATDVCNTLLTLQNDPIERALSSSNKKR